MPAKSRASRPRTSQVQRSVREDISNEPAKGQAVPPLIHHEDDEERHESFESSEPATHGLPTAEDHEDDSVDYEDDRSQSSRGSRDSTNEVENYSQRNVKIPKTGRKMGNRRASSYSRNPSISEKRAKRTEEDRAQRRDLVEDYLTAEYDAKYRPHLDWYSPTEWMKFLVDFDKFKKHRGNVSIGECLSDDAFEIILIHLPDEYEDWHKLDCPDELFRDFLCKEPETEEIAEIINQMKALKMTSKRRDLATSREANEYLLQMERLRRSSNDNIRESVYNKILVNGLSNAQGLRTKMASRCEARDMARKDLLREINKLVAELEKAAHPEPPGKRESARPRERERPTHAAAAAATREQPSKAYRSPTEPVYTPRGATERQSPPSATAYAKNPVYEKRSSTYAPRDGPSFRESPRPSEFRDRREGSRPQRTPTMRSSTTISVVQEEEPRRSAHRPCGLTQLKETVSAHMDSGANIPLIHPRLAKKLVEAGCKERSAQLRVSGFNHASTVLRQQITGVKVLFMSPTGPLEISMDPYVYEIADDLIIDKETLLQTGLVAIQTLEDPTQYMHRSDDCAYCGLIQQEVEPISSKPDHVIGARVPEDELQASLTKTIGPDMDQAKIQDVLYRHLNAFQPDFTAQSVQAFKIEVKTDATLPTIKPRRMSPNDTKMVQGHVDELLKLGVIRESQSSVSSPVVLVKYEDGTSRLCVDYRVLNDCTADLRYPTRNLKEVLDHVAGKKFLGKIDLYKGYHQIAMDPESIPLTAFVTPTGLYEYVRLPFGLKNAPSAFQQIMDKVFRDLIPRVVEVYLDDIIVFGDSEEEFLRNLDTVLTRLSTNRLTAKVSKCKFGYRELSFLGFVVNANGIKMHPDRVRAIGAMSPPTNKKALRSYLGLVNYCADFIPQLSTIARPLYQLTHKNAEFTWGAAQSDAFGSIQDAIAKAPELEFIQYDQPIYLRTDASDVAIGGVLFQEYDGKKHVVEYFSRAFTKTERNWSTLEKESFGVYYGILHCHPHISGHHFIVQTDHRNILFLHQSDVPKLVRWRLRLQEYDFTVEHIAGSANIVADVLSRTCSVCTVRAQAAVDSQREAGERKSLIAQFHNSTMGHKGREPTCHALQAAGHDWPNMRRDIAEYIRACDTCQKNAPYSTNTDNIPKGSLAVFEPFERIDMDFIGPLPTDLDGKCFILVVVDAFTRWVELFALSNCTAESVGICLSRLALRYGPFRQILSDNGPAFIASSIKSMLEEMDTNHVFSTPYHHQGNGQVERVNREVMRHVRSIVYDENLYSYWSRTIPRVQYLLNTSVHSSTNCTPMELMFGKAITPHRGMSGTMFRKSIVTNVEAYRLKHAEKIDELFKIAQAKQKRLMKEQLTDQPEHPKEFQLGEWVLLDPPDQTPESKLHPRRQGPLKVMARDKNTYVLHNVLTGRSLKAHVSRIQAYQLNDETLTNVEELLAKDRQEYIVEAILRHARNDDGSYKFLVKWKDYGREEDQTWEPTELLVNTEAFKLYAKSKKLKVKDMIPMA